MVPFARYNRGVKTAYLLPLVLSVAALLAGCASQEDIDNKAAIHDAMVEYLRANSSQTGLDPDAMDVNVDAVAINRDVARATVSFRIKGGDQGMQMNYTLDRVGNKWVTRKPNSKGAPHPAVEQEQLPQAPAVPLPAPTPGAPLPEGHPPVDPGNVK